MPRIDLDELAFELPDGSWVRRQAELPALDDALPGASYAARAYEYIAEDGSSVRVHVGPEEPRADEDGMHDRVAARLELEWVHVTKHLTGAERDETGPSFFPGDVYVGYLGGLDEGTKTVVIACAMCAGDGPTISFVISLRYQDDDEIEERIEDAHAICETVELGAA